LLILVFDKGDPYCDKGLLIELIAIGLDVISPRYVPSGAYKDAENASLKLNINDIMSKTIKNRFINRDLYNFCSISSQL
jgi:hypothetical protein